MRKAIKLERVETSYGVVKFNGEILGVELIVQNLWVMCTDGWDEIDPKCSWANKMFNGSSIVVIGRIIEKYGSTESEIVRVVGA